MSTENAQHDDAAPQGARQPKILGGEGSSAGVASMRNPHRRRRRAVRAGLLTSLTLAASIIAAAYFTRAPWPPRGWLLVMCDVGQGDGLLLADGEGSAIAVDTGPDPAKEDACLTDLGIRHVRLVILTHFHADHVDGLPGLLHGRQVDEIETTVVDDPPEGAAKVRAWAAAADVRTSTATVGERRTYGTLTWEVLWPDPASPVLAGGAPSVAPQSGAERKSGGRAPRRGTRASHGGEEGSAPNNASIVLRVRDTTPDGAVTLLLTGDIEPPAQEAILAAHPNPADLAADVFKVPHHGSANQAPGLVAAVRPRVSLISVGAGNTYGHPAARTLALAGSTGARAFRTDRDGAIAVIGTAGRLQVVLRR